MEQLYCKTRAEWRRWLAKHHDKESGVWLVFLKIGTGEQSLDYDSVVEEALCYGWIDSIIKKLDDERYARKLTPRKADSRWSASNKKRVAKLIKNGQMTKFGLAKIEAAKKYGLWTKSPKPKISRDIPVEFQHALTKNKIANAFFEQLAPSYRRQFIGWIAIAKRPETQARRIKESIALLARGEKLGMK